MKKTIFLLVAIASIAFAEDAKAPNEADIRAEYWKASAFAQGAHAALRDSMTDAQKQLEARREDYSKQADAAQQKMKDLCAGKDQVLDANTFACVAKKVEEPKK